MTAYQLAKRRALRFFARAAIEIYNERTGEKVRKVPLHLRLAVLSHAHRTAERECAK